MKVLLDTNIIIHREASQVIKQDIGLLFNWLDKLNYKKLIHPCTKDELASHQNEKVVNTMSIKVQNYTTLKTLSSDTPEIIELRKDDKTQNSIYDTDILKELYNNRVDFLITEDRGIHRKAQKLSIVERVFTVDDFLEKILAENPEWTTYEVLAVEKKYFGDINMNDPFFNSFRGDYKGFDKWFNKKSDEEVYVSIGKGSFYKKLGEYEGHQILLADGKFGSFIYHNKYYFYITSPNSDDFSFEDAITLIDHRRNEHKDLSIFKEKPIGANSKEKVNAFLFIKIEDIDENYSNIVPVFPAKKRLKIGTLKVVSTGLKLGERFLKVIFDNALRFNVEEIYVTIFDKRPEQKMLIKLLEDWGFKYWGKKTSTSGTENVYIRNFSPAPNLLDPKKSYPFISKSKKQFIVPIYPNYHTDLFPDSILTNEKIENFLESKAHRNAIQKVYVSRSWNKSLDTGDLIVFYRTKSSSAGFYTSVITTIGVVENVYLNIKDEEQFIQLCRKRSVFSDEELRAQWNYKKHARPFVVHFLYVKSFPKPYLNLEKLKEFKILSDAPRGFETLSLGKFNSLLKKSNIDESIVIN